MQHRELITSIWYFNKKFIKKLATKDYGKTII